VSTPDITWKELQSGAVDAIKSTFPIEGRTRSLVLNNVNIDDSGAVIGDLRSQERAKETNRTWGANVVADISLVDKATGNVIDRSKTKIFTLPRPTERYSYIVDGSEWQVDNLWRLKPGVYSQIKANGELETEFALAGASFAKESRLKIPFSPENKKFKFRWGTTNINLYPILKTLGVQDEEMKKAWGPDIYKANSTAKIEQDILKLYKGISKRGVKAENSSYDAIAAAVFKEFHNAELAPDTTKHTLGKPISHVTGEALLLASKRILDVAQGITPPDDRNSLIFKKLTGVDDFLRERLSKSSTQRIIKLKVGNNIDRADKVRDILSSELFSKPIKQIFTNSSLSKNPEQTNPLEMISNYRSTTILGGDEGGIKSDRTLNKQMKLINPTHMGFLDPIHTPESVRTGISLTLPLGVTKDGNEARATVYDLKEHKVLEGKKGLTPAELHSEFILLPDQVRMKDGRPVQPKNLVKMKDPETGEIVLRPMKDARYMFVSPHQLFDEATNLIPFLQNNQGNRTMTASRQASQAVGLRDREVPLVQVQGGNTTWEHLIGIPFSQTAPTAGKILAIKSDQSDNRFPDSIVLQDKGGKKHEIQLYNHFPLNDTKTFMHSIPKVQVGQEVKEGDLLADTNFTRDGKLALGTNLRVSYMPYKGYNFEDGIVISHSAAQKLTSEHVHRKSIEIDPTKDSMNKKKFQAFSSVTAKKYGKTQLDRLDDDGVIRIGEKVSPGDLLIAAVGKKENLGMVTRLAARLDKSLFDRTDRSVSWDGSAAGEVVKVQKLANGKGAVVHVRTDEPAEVGDKIVGRHGNKCFDENTEVLTDIGWKKFSSLNRTECIATLNQNTFQIEYQLPTAYVAESYNGKMYRFQGRRLDLLVTPNHNHFVRGRSDRSKEEGKWRLESAESCFGKQRVHLRTGEWNPVVDCDVITIPGRPHEPHQHYEFSKPKMYDADDFLEFFGYWVTEGCISDSKVLVAQRKEVNPETYEQIRVCLIRLGYEPWCYPDTLGFSDPRLAHWLSKFGKARDKYIPRSFLSTNKRQLKILADACFAGDGGNYYREKDNHTRYELFTSSKRLADDYQELAFKLGMSANIKEAAEGRKVVRFSLNPEVWTTKDVRYGEKESWVEYNGMIYCVEVPNHIIYIRRNGIPVWSGNSIVTQIIPDHEMPRIGTPDGQHVEVLMNPSGVPSRINLGQMLETAASKIAVKTGKPYIVNNFDSVNTEDYTEKVKQDLKDHGLTDTEEIYDPVTHRKLGDVLTGDQYIMKLKHQVEKKLAVRSTANYTIDRAPKGTGSENPGQGIGQLEFYALLAHGARKNLKEMATYKADQQVDERLNPQAHIDFWHRVQMGQPLPAPRPTFAYRKFESYLNGLGINVRKEGHEMQLTPLTDKGVLAMSNGEIEDPGRVLRGKDAKELEKGLFDPKVTGGLPDSNEPGKGLNWAHITLARPMPSPIFVGTAQKPGPAVILTGLKFNEFEDIVKGKKTLNGKTGGEAIKEALDGVNVKKELSKVMAELPELRGSALNHANRKAKYLRSLDSLNMKPSEAYMMNHVPVIPPVFRPIVPMPDGSLRFDDINHLYKDLGIVNNKLKEGVKDLPEVEQPLREELYDLLKSTMGVGGIPQYESSRKLKGILDTIAGTSPKQGFFQKKLMKRRQELSMRSTIIPEPAMHLDYVGIPRSAAMELYKPFVIRELKGVGRSPLEARKDLKEETPAAWRALEKALESRPILLKRDPALHKFSIMAFKPKLVDGKAIRIHPLVTSGFNADFDGDTMSAFLPLTDDAVREAHKMFPSNNLFSSTNGGIMYAPSQESLLGLHLLSKWGKESDKKYQNFDQARKDYDKGSLPANEVVSVNGKRTTYGRRLLANALPKEYQTDQLLYDPHLVISKKGVSLKRSSDTDNGESASSAIGILSLLSDIGKKDPKKFANTVDRLKDIGNKHAYDVGFSLSLNDLKVHKDIRNSILDKADEEAATIRKSSASTQDKEDKLVTLYDGASHAMDKAIRPLIEKSHNNIYTMVDSGARGNWSQFRQMNIAPMIMQDATGRKLPTPVKRSYSEGLDVGDYWTALHGARMGTLQRAEGTSEPGMLTKDIINFVMPEMIVSHECGTKEGISMSINDEDVHDRLLAKPISVGGQKFDRNTIVTPAMTSLLKKNRIDQIVVRSPLKCQHGLGICSKCFGLNENGVEHEIGTNIGVIAGHSLGEPAMQLAMDSFHTGGVSGSRGAGATTRIGRLKELLKLPAKLPDSATLARTSGKVDKIEKDPTGWNIYINGQPHFAPATRKLLYDNKPLEVGMSVKKGSPITEGPINPRDLLPLTDVPTVQNHLVSELYDGIYKDERVRRRNIEMIVRSLTNLSQIRDPGDTSGFMTGDVVSRSLIEEHNRNLEPGHRPIDSRPVLKGMEQGVLDTQEDWLARLNFRRLKETVMEGAAKGWKTNIHGTHPVPAYAFGSEFGEGTKREPWKYG